MCRINILLFCVFHDHTWRHEFPLCFCHKWIFHLSLTANRINGVITFSVLLRWTMIVCTTFRYFHSFAIVANSIDDFVYTKNQWVFCMLPLFCRLNLKTNTHSMKIHSIHLFFFFFLQFNRLMFSLTYKIYRHTVYTKTSLNEVTQTHTRTLVHWKRK